MRVAKVEDHCLYSNISQVFTTEFQATNHFISFCSKQGYTRVFTVLSLYILQRMCLDTMNSQETLCLVCDTYVKVKYRAV